MGDTCTASPTFTSFSTSTLQTFSVSQSASESLSIGEGTILTRSIESGTEWILTQSSVAGATATAAVQVPVTITAQQVIRVPVATLFAPCTSETSSTSTTTSSTTTSTTTTSTSTSTSTSIEPTNTSQTSATSSERTSQSNSHASDSHNTSTAPTPAPTPIPTPSRVVSSSFTETGTLTTITSVGSTTLPNGSQSSYVTLVTSSIAPNGSLNDSQNGGKSGSGSGRAVAIGAGVTGGIIALIILMFGITWHIRRKRKNAFDDLNNSEIWGPNHEAKALQSSVNSSVHGPGYTYNPYGEPRSIAYAPVPSMSPPRPMSMPLADPDDRGLPGAGYGVPQGGGLGVAAPLLTRAKTADEILYEAAREGLPRSRTSSATASHHTRPSETGTSHQPHPSLSASNLTHGSMKSRRSESVVGLLEHPAIPSARTSLYHDAQVAQQYHDLIDVPDRPMSPVSVVAPRLAIVNPDEDKDL